MKKMSISPIQGDTRPDVEELMEIKEEEEEDKITEEQSSRTPKLVLVITIPYVIILPLFSRNLHDWYTTSLLCLFVCFTLDLVAIGLRFYPILRPLSSLEAASLTAMLLFYAKYICLKYQSPLSCFLLLKLKTTHKKMFKAMVEDDF
ncbi:hypothetical protein GCK72_005525 [Caenorhabditis remanei]|uniref:Uncharacterized protein n=1 Tax=Caenorhabditis remanei TaxID=31234 RepID=A0A6A5HGT3_CAERE|nr:hypothetical protein GCK72_005525 [Caenorhabditis remanei]KAF1765573.1 hypothetical protein GCK72_005525 [Caenorhabditis remanei]